MHIPIEVYDEVVIAGAGMPGAATVSKADWLHVTPVQDAEGLSKAIIRTVLVRGEISAIFLAKELAADLTLMDERKSETGFGGRVVRRRLYRDSGRNVSPR